MSLPVTARITNTVNNLHGGASCTLVDTLSCAATPAMTLNALCHALCAHCAAAMAATAALLVNDVRMSVTIDLHVTCVSAAPLGSRLEVESTVEQAGG